MPPPTSARTDVLPPASTPAETGKASTEVLPQTAARSAPRRRSKAVVSCSFSQAPFKHFSTNIIPQPQIPVKFSHEWEVKTIKEVKIPKKIRQYKESIFFGLSARQFFCAIFAVGIAAGAYLLLGDVIGKETASWLCIVLAAPAAMAGFFNYNGMTFEQFLWAFIKTEFLFAGDRKYVGENLCYNSFNRKGRGDFD